MLSMTLQPLCYSVSETQTAVHLAAGSEAVTGLDMASALPVPLRIQVRPTSGVVTRARFAIGSRVLDLPSMHLQSGQMLEYDAGMLLGDVSGLKVDGTADFSPAPGGRWARLVLDAGSEVISCLVEGGAADVTIAARGRWPA